MYKKHYYLSIHTQNPFQIQDALHYMQEKLLFK